MKKLCILFTLFILAFPLYASPYNIIPVGDPILDDLRFLSLESGHSFLSFTPPLSPQEVEQFLDSLDFTILSDPAKEAYTRISERLIPSAPLSFLSSDNFLMTININSTIEASARSNNEISWYPRDPRIPPFLSLPVSLFFSDRIMLYMEPSLTMKTENFINSINPVGTNASPDYHNLDFFMPLRAFAAAGGSWWNFQLGRDRLSYGTGRMGNLSISDNPDFYEFMRFSLFSRYVKYTSLTIQMPLEINDSLIPNDPDWKIYRTTNRYLYVHRLDFNLFNRLSIGLMEGIMVGNSPLELRFLNPMMIFHNFFGWNDYEPWHEDTNRESVIGSLFSVEANWNIIPSLAVYGQFVMNEWATADELLNDPEQPPNGTGYMLGIQYSHSFSTWAAAFFFEFTSTDPFLYFNPSPFASYIHMRKTPAPYYTFIGYPRDLLVFTLGGNFFKNDTLNISAVFSLLLNGERDMKYDWDIDPNLALERNPSGIAEHQYIGSLAARWKINHLFTLKGSITGIYSHNNKHRIDSNETGVQASLSLTFSY